VWIIVIVVLLLMCCCAVTVGGLGLGLFSWRREAGFDFDVADFTGLGVEATATMREQFAVEGTPLLDVDCPVCDVEISAGSGAVVEIEVTKHAWAGDRDAAERALDRIDVSLIQRDERILIKVDMPQLQQLGGDWREKRARVDLEITVPQQTDLKLQLDIADVEVEGIEGQVDISTDVGQVELKDVVVRDSLKVRTNVARIRFEGVLGEGVRCDIRSDVGDIALTLPADSSFEIDAESNVGAVTCDFDVRGVQGRKQLVGGRIEGTVGESPTVELKLQSEVGSIRINED
jgi:hypothetical protein